MTDAPLPPHFTSLYRLFLRATSASVLHNARATRGLRRLYRPSFEAAVLSIRYQEARGLYQSEQTKAWLDEFDRRMNRTLNLLHSSSVSRGLPHRVTHRLSALAGLHSKWMKETYFKPGQFWNPQLHPDSAKYKVKPSIQPARHTEKKQDPWPEVKDAAWGALGDVIHMAEGRDGLVLGRVRFDMKHT